MTNPDGMPPEKSGPIFLNQPGMLDRESFTKEIEFLVSMPAWEYSVSSLFEYPDRTPQWTKSIRPEDWVGYEEAVEWYEHVKQLNIESKIVRRRTAGPVEDYKVNG